MLSVISHQGNTNQKHSEIPFLSYTLGLLESKSSIITSIGKDVEKLKPPLYC